MPTSESYRFKVEEGEGVRQAKVVNQRGRRGIEDVRWGRAKMKQEMPVVNQGGGSRKSMPVVSQGGGSRRMPVVKERRGRSSEGEQVRMWRKDSEVERESDTLTQGGHPDGAQYSVRLEDQRSERCGGRNGEVEGGE